MTLALLTVDEREMLSVLAFSRELKREAARPLFLIVCVFAVDEVESSTELTIASSEVALVPALPLILLDLDALMDSPSSSSSTVCSSFNAWLGLKERALRRRPFIPPLLIMVAVGVASCMVPRSMSSFDMRFSEAVKFPWERGEGRVILGVAVGADVEVDVEVDGVTAAGAAVKPEGRTDVAVEVEEDEELLL